MPHKDFYDPETGKRWPSVTEICSIINKPGVNAWRGIVGSKKADKILKNAQDIGLEVHEVIQQYLENSFVGHEVYSDKAIKMAEEVHQKFIIPHNVKPICLERQVVSQKLKFSGTLDGVITVDNSPCIVDWKTSNQIDKTVALQLCGYLIALDEQTYPVPFPVNDGLIVQVHKTTHKVKLYEFKDLRQYNDLFLSALKLWYFTQE